MYMCAGDRIDGGGGRWGGTPLMGEWRAWKWRAGARLNACPSPASLPVTGGLSFSPSDCRRICPALFPYDRPASPICMYDRQQTGPVHVKIGGGAWQFQHNAVSFWLDPRPPCHVSFHNQPGRRRRWGEGMAQARFLPAPPSSGINLIALPLVMPLLPFSHFLLFLCLFCSGLLVVSLCLSVVFALTLSVCCFKITVYFISFLSLFIVVLSKMEIMSSLFFLSWLNLLPKNGLIMILHVVLFPIYFELINLKNGEKKTGRKKSLFIHRSLRRRPAGTHGRFHLIKNHQMLNKIAARSCFFFYFIHYSSRVSFYLKAKPADYRRDGNEDRIDIFITLINTMIAGDD